MSCAAIPVWIYPAYLCLCMPAVVSVFTARQRGLPWGQSARPPWLHSAPGMPAFASLALHPPAFLVFLSFVITLPSMHPLLCKLIRIRTTQPTFHWNGRLFQRHLRHCALNITHVNAHAHTYPCMCTLRFLGHVHLHIHILNARIIPNTPRNKQHYICMLRHGLTPSQAHVCYLSVTHSICFCLHA